MRLWRAGTIAATLLLPVLWPAVAEATLTLTAPASAGFSDNLNGGDQTPGYTLGLTAGDTATGASPGWNLTITSTDLTAGTHRLANTASRVTAVSSSCSGTCTVNPTNTTSYPFTVPAGTTAPAAVKLFNASAHTGQGSFTITPSISVTVPQNSFSGSYTSTITLAIVSGP